MTLRYYYNSINAKSMLALCEKLSRLPTMKFSIHYISEEPD